MDSSFCQQALSEALDKYGRPEIFNSDQSNQFTAQEFINILAAGGITISMDGKGRCLDNIFIERFWRSVKHENVCLNDYHNIPEAREGLGKYFEFYNFERFHQSLDDKTPGQAHSQKGASRYCLVRLNRKNWS